MAGLSVGPRGLCPALVLARGAWSKVRQWRGRGGQCGSAWISSSWVWEPRAHGKPMGLGLGRGEPGRPCPHPMGVGMLVGSALGGWSHHSPVIFFPLDHTQNLLRCKMAVGKQTLHQPLQGFGFINKPLLRKN